MPDWIFQRLPICSFHDYPCERGGEKMKDSYEQRVHNQFGGFCTKVLKNEVCRILNEYARQRKKVTLWKRKAV
jgi:hypothetical protein